MEFDTNGRMDGRTNTHGNSVHRDRRRHAVSTSLRLGDKPTNGQTPKIIFAASDRPSVS